jgi:hypothetical protein
MQIMMANEVTGEVIEWKSEYGWKDSVGLGAIRGYIRNWMKGGLNIHQFSILKVSSEPLRRYVQQYAWEHMLTKCDVCQTPRKNSELAWLDDLEGVCLMAICKGKCN